MQTIRLLAVLSFFLPAVLTAQNVVTLAMVGSGDREVGTVNPATGAVALPGSPIAGGALSSASGVNSLDTVANRFFFIGSIDGGVTNRLYSIHPLTGAVIGFHPLSGGSTNINGLEYDNGEGVLYALASVGAGGRQLASIDPATGAVTLLFSQLAGGSISSVSGADDLDPSGNRYFFAGQPSGGNPKIYSINTSTGAVANPDLGGAAINGIVGLEYDEGESVLYALASVGASFDRQLATINPATGLVTLLGSPIAGAGLSSVSGADTLDPAGNRYYFAGQPAGGNPKIYSINTQTFAVAANPDLSGDSTNLLGFDWDAGPLPVELTGLSVE